MKKPEKQEKSKNEAPQLVGIIASIPPGSEFVLIQSYGPWKQPAGTILTTRGGNERTANLRFSGETLGQFAAADIQSGSVEKGDAVYSLHTPKPKSPSTDSESPDPPQLQGSPDFPQPTDSPLPDSFSPTNP